MENRGNWLVVVALAVLIAGLIVAAVVITRGEEETADSTTTTTTSDGTTTTVDSTTSTSESTTPTVPISPQDEIRRSAAQLWELRDEVLQNPNPARIAEYAVEQSPLYANDRSLISQLVADNARWNRDPSTVVGVRLDAIEGGSPEVTIVVDSAEADIVDANGRSLQHYPAARVAYGASLLGAPGSWNFNAFFELDQISPSVVEDIVRLGVP